MDKKICGISGFNCIAVPYIVNAGELDLESHSFPGAHIRTLEMRKLVSIRQIYLQAGNNVQEDNCSMPTFPIGRIDTDTGNDGLIKYTVNWQPIYAESIYVGFSENKNQAILLIVGRGE